MRGHSSFAAVPSGFERRTPNGPLLYKSPETVVNIEDAESIIRYAAFKALKRVLDYIGEGETVHIDGLNAIPREVIDRIVREALA